MRTVAKQVWVLEVLIVVLRVALLVPPEKVERIATTASLATQATIPTIAIITMTTTAMAECPVPQELISQS